MAFPPEFSSTLTYANRYDLDEIDVFLEGDSSKPMFFSISGLPKQLSFGKHYFNLSTLDSKNQDYELRMKSRILFEFKSKNNVVIQSDVTPLKQKNGVANCFVEVLQDPLRTWMDIEDGEGTLTIVGSLQNKQGRGQSIPEKFREAINYRCIFPIEIRKNLINADSPKVLQSKHELKTVLGQFSFAKSSVPTRKNSITGTKYSVKGTPVNIPLKAKAKS
jgi:hypothetical protein|tara:strand:+ start:303 stop:959 length:657 start_codon:yes stop_codon:yes gene_type:complete